MLRIYGSSHDCSLVYGCVRYWAKGFVLDNTLDSSVGARPYARILKSFQEVFGDVENYWSMTTG